MWRRLTPSQLQALLTVRSAAIKPRRISLVAVDVRPSTTAHFNRHFSSESGNVSAPKRVEDVVPIATGHEREEIEAELQGRDLKAMDYPVGPFGTKEAPAIIQSVYDRRIVGCPGGEDEDEHDVVWFWLQKGKPHECSVCGQYFMLEVVGEGGDPEGHTDDDDDDGRY